MGSPGDAGGSTRRLDYVIMDGGGWAELSVIMKKVTGKLRRCHELKGYPGFQSVTDYDLNDNGDSVMQHFVSTVVHYVVGACSGDKGEKLRFSSCCAFELES